MIGRRYIQSRERILAGLVSYHLTLEQNYHLPLLNDIVADEERTIITDIVKFRTRVLPQDGNVGHLNGRRPSWRRIVHVLALELLMT